MYLAGKRITKMRLLKRPSLPLGTAVHVFIFEAIFEALEVSALHCHELMRNDTSLKRSVQRFEAPPFMYVFICQRKNWVWSKVCIFFKIYNTYTTRWANFLSLQKLWMNFGCISMSFHRFFCGKRQKEKKYEKWSVHIFRWKKSNWFSWSKLAHEHDSSLFQFVVVRNLKIKSILDAWMCPSTVSKIAVEGRCKKIDYSLHLWHPFADCQIGKKSSKCLIIWIILVFTLLKRFFEVECHGIKV